MATTMEKVKIVWEYMGIFIYFVCFVYRVKCEDYSSPRNPSKIKKNKTYKTHRHEQCKLLKQKKKK